MYTLHPAYISPKQRRSSGRPRAGLVSFIVYGGMQLATCDLLPFLNFILENPESLTSQRMRFFRATVLEHRWTSCGFIVLVTNTHCSATTLGTREAQHGGRRYEE